MASNASWDSLDKTPLTREDTPLEVYPHLTSERKCTGNIYLIDYVLVGFGCNEGFMMFGLFKKLNKKDSHQSECFPQTVVENSTQCTNNSQMIDRKIEDLKTQIEEYIEVDNKEASQCIADLLEDLGSLYEDSNQIDEAISAYEQSLEHVMRMGKSYQRLLILYNKKRACAASVGNDEQMKLYFEKVQTLMQSSKDMLRGK